MKIKNKGKVYPSPSPPPPPSSSSSSSYSINGDDSLSPLRHLPATILVLVSLLSSEDREVLAYLTARSLKTTTTTSLSSSSSPVTHDSKKSNKKKKNHRSPVFDCECFDCYTSYWLRWDSSPNREAIHKVIEAFEDHLTNGENSSSQKSKKNNGRGKKKEKSGRRVLDKGKTVEISSSISSLNRFEESMEEATVASDEVPPQNDTSSPEKLTGEGGEEVAGKEVEKPMTVVRTAVAETGHKGLARKVLPDVMGLFNSRFWSLWNPNA